MTGAGVQDDQHLVLLARCDPLAQPFQQDGVMVDVLVGIQFAQLFVREIFLDVDRRLSPVGGAPRHVDASPVGIVGQQLIQVVAVLGLQYGLGAGSGVSRARGGLIHLQVFTLRQQRIGVALIAVELEVGFSGRFADHEHYHRLLLVSYPAVSELYLLCLFVVAETGHTTDVHHIRPGLQQSSQFRVVLADPQRLTDMHRGDGEDDGQRTAAADSQSLRTPDDHWLKQTIQGRQYAKDS